MKFFEDLRVGERADIGSHTFTAGGIKAFAIRHDPQPFHLDEAAAFRLDPGGVHASGWHIACLWMRLVIDHRHREDEARRVRGQRIAALGASPGFQNLTWPHPVYAGDTVVYATEIIGKRVSASRPRWGILSSRNTGLNQHGQLVLEFFSSVFVERRFE